MIKIKKLKKYLSEIIAILLTPIILFPVYMLIVNSMKDKAGAASMSLKLPEKFFALENYSYLLKEGGVGQAFINSVLITGVSVSGIVIFSAMAAFIINRCKIKLVSIMNGFILAGMFLPISMIPTYFMVKNLSLNSSFIGICLVYIASFFPMAVFLYTGFLKSIPSEIDEAAFLDGSGTFRLFFKIILPLLKPVTATVLIMNFMSVWNEFGIAIYFLNTPKKYTMVMTMFNYFGTHSADWNLIFSSIVLMSLPVVIMYFSLQKYIVSGMTAGAVKS